ncbi:MULTISPECIES: hypothetical protein [unclassified Streptomyces]|uniref:hypothetical protein n=1 Tax=unclassified Streptomyces TaxID=2593676 RepID=UPI00117C2C59|nr:hypothetical protein [Streptomyces sp. IB201691-2A2]TRO59298.1 hypothetical protein E4K73_34270 [Streptomyces sp. IB201691-2A2]
MAAPENQDPPNQVENGPSSAEPSSPQRPAAQAGPNPHLDGRGSTDSESPESAIVRIGRTVAAIVTVAAAFGGLVLGCRAEQRDARAEQREVNAEQREEEDQERAYAERVDFYRSGSNVVVVSNSARVMSMRLVLRGRVGVWWDLNSIRPCTQITIPNTALFRSMASQVPELPRLTEGDLGGLRLEFEDPGGRSWIRTSGGAVSRSEWKPGSAKVAWVDTESWSLAWQKSPDCA